MITVERVKECLRKNYPEMEFIVKDGKDGWLYALFEIRNNFPVGIDEKMWSSSLETVVRARLRNMLYEMKDKVEEYIGMVEPERRGGIKL